MAVPTKKPKAGAKPAGKGGVVGALTRKFGPLPAWAWLLIAGVGIFIWRGRGGGSATGTPANDVSVPSGFGGGLGGGAGEESGGGGGGTPTDSGATPPPSTLIQGLSHLPAQTTAQKQTSAAQKNIIAQGGGAFIRTGKGQKASAATVATQKSLSAALIAGTSRKQASHAATAKPIITTGKGRLPAGIKIPTRVTGKATVTRVVHASKPKQKKKQ